MGQGHAGVPAGCGTWRGFTSRPGPRAAHRGRRGAGRFAGTAVRNRRRAAETGAAQRAWASSGGARPPVRVRKVMRCQRIKIGAAPEVPGSLCRPGSLGPAAGGTNRPAGVRQRFRTLKPAVVSCAEHLPFSQRLTRPHSFPAEHADAGAVPFCPLRDVRRSDGGCHAALSDRHDNCLPCHDRRPADATSDQWILALSDRTPWPGGAPVRHCAIAPGSDTRRLTRPPWSDNNGAVRGCQPPCGRVRRRDTRQRGTVGRGRPWPCQRPMSSAEMAQLMSQCCSEALCQTLANHIRR